MIDSTTRLYGLLGNPVSGSRSPWIHNTVFEAYSIPGVYLAFAVPPEALEDALTGLKALQVRGINVTIPYKTAVMPFLDSVDPMAEALGAVNTVVCDAGGWRGYNTDGSGLLAVLKRRLPVLKELRILVLGAGGAARGICGALLHEGTGALGIWNRSPEKAELLVSELGSLAGKGQSFFHVESEAAFQEFDLVINTTSLGMEPDTDASPASVASLKPGAVVCDIVYKPHRTRFLRKAAAAGHPVIYGIEMLIEQALLAQQLWNHLTDLELDRIRNSLIEEFEGFYK